MLNLMFVLVFLCGVATVTLDSFIDHLSETGKNLLFLIQMLNEWQNISKDFRHWCLLYHSYLSQFTLTNSIKKRYGGANGEISMLTNEAD